MGENKILGNKLALVLSIIAILAYIFGPVVAFTTTQNKVSNLEEDLNVYNSEISNIEDRVQQLEIIAAINSVSLQSIQDDISEIKTDIKDIKRGGGI